MGLAVAQFARERDARLEVRPAPGRAEDAEDVVGLGEGALVLRSFREPERFGGEPFRARRVARAVRGEAPVREDPRLLALPRAGLARGAVVALRLRPVAAAVMDLRELELDAGARGRGRLRRGRLVALDRPAVVAVQRVEIADRGRGAHFGRRGLVAERPGFDRVLQRTRLRRRRDAELLIEESDRVAVLMERGGAVAPAGVEPHEVAVRGLVQRIGSETFLRLRDRRREVAVALGGRGESGERFGVIGAERIGLSGLPVVERRAVAEREALEEVAAIDRDRAREVATADRAPEFDHVDGQILPIEVDRLALGLEPPIAEGRAQHRECPSQRTAALLLVGVGPQQRRERRAALPPLRHGEVREQCRRLAGVGLDRLAADLDARRAEERHAQPGHPGQAIAPPASPRTSRGPRRCP